MSVGSRPVRHPSNSRGSAEKEKGDGNVFEEILNTADLEAFLISSKTRGFIVIQQDRLLYEHYFNSYGLDRVLQSHSVTKSFVFTLIGIAVAERKIGNVEDPITTYLPELKREQRFAKIRIRLLGANSVYRLRGSRSLAF